MRSKTRDTVALIFASLFPLAMALVYFVVLAVPAGQIHPGFMIAFTVGKAIQFLFPVAYVAIFEPGELRPSRPAAGGLMLGAGFGLLVAAAMFVLYVAAIQHIDAVTLKTPGMIYGKLEQFHMTTPLGFLVVAAVICMVHSLMEEYYWRWFVFGRMRRYMSLAAAVALSSIGFMLHHIVILGVYFPDNFWMLALPFSFCVGVGGGVWAWIYDRTGSIYAAWLSHAIIDAAILALGFWMIHDMLH